MFPENQIIQYPNGRYGFVGRVYPRLAFVTLDDEEPTPEQIRIAREFGPRLAKLKTRSFETMDAALEALTEVTS